MENINEIIYFLEGFSKSKPETIPQELNNYLAYVARTGDPVFEWSLVKDLFKEKLINVMTDFHKTSYIDITSHPNVGPFNYDITKNGLLERIDSFTSAPFTIQRLSELLTFPRKHYNRLDKFMRALEKNIFVVSTVETSLHRNLQENGEAEGCTVNSSDCDSKYNIDVQLEGIFLDR